MAWIDEPIALLEKRYNYQPRTFLWRGRRHAVWTVGRRAGRRRGGCGSAWRAPTGECAARMARCTTSTRTGPPIPGTWKRSAQPQSIRI